MREILIAALVVIRVLFGAPDYLSSADSCLLRASTYSFFHASWIHLAINCLGLWFIYSPRRKNRGRILFVSLMIAALVYPFSLRPAIGFSNVLYASLGLYSPSLRNPWWRRTETLTFFSVTILMLFIPGVAALTHILSFITGACIAALVRGVRSSVQDVLQDAGRYLK